jgi:glycosyltransferase involved in cell wall biosynthesis
MTEPRLTIIIPTFDRPTLVRDAVRAALAQDIDGVEVLVVDDGSPQPVVLDEPEFAGVTVVRQENAGICVARNTGVAAATTRWVGFCDDDDRLLPHYARLSLEAAEAGNVPRPVAVLSGLTNVDEAGEVLDEHVPPTLERGRHFWMEEQVTGTSFLSKQTLVVERDVLMELGGFDPEISGREWTDLMPRLNERCSVVGVPTVTYRRFKHTGPRISTAPSRRQRDFERVVDRQRDRLAKHPRGHARFLYDHAYTSWRIGQKTAAVRALSGALRRSPNYTIGRVVKQAGDVAGGLLRGKAPGQA